LSHLHIPDGVLPPQLWIAGLVLAFLALLVAVRATRGAGPQQIAYQSALGGIMLAVMAIPVPITAFDYCMTLAGPVGVLLGAGAAFQVSLVVTLILALMGQGGFTVIGLNALVLGAGAAMARPVYLRALGAGRSPAAAMAIATAVSQVFSSLLWVVVLWASVRLTPDIAVQQEVREGLRFLAGGSVAAIVAVLMLTAVAVESMLGFGLARFLARVRPDLLPASMPPASTPLRTGRPESGAL
jgi:cobalt/nickel transport system permease protein